MDLYNNLYVGSVDHKETYKFSNKKYILGKTTSKYKKWNISATTGLILLKFKLKLRGTNQSMYMFPDYDDP
jgi:hypothetical protein